MSSGTPASPRDPPKLAIFNCLKFLNRPASASSKSAFDPGLRHVKERRLSRELSNDARTGSIGSCIFCQVMPASLNAGAVTPTGDKFGEDSWVSEG